jgi:hypothetical protein
MRPATDPPRLGATCTLLTVLALAACAHPDPIPAPVPITLDPIAWLAPAPPGTAYVGTAAARS